MREQIYPELKKEIELNSNAVGALIIPSPPAHLTAVEPVDLLLFVLVRKTPQQATVYHYRSWRIKTVWVSWSCAFASIINGERGDYVEWILHGEILYDPERKVEELATIVQRFPTEYRSKKMCIELCSLLEGYQRSRWHLKLGEVMDAYLSIQETLKRWGRLAVMEAGEFPRQDLWNQIRRLQPGIYKWYQELASGGESPEQRIRLVLLAVEYAVISKLEWYGRYILNLLQQQKEMWSLGELNEQFDAENISIDLSLLMEEMVKRSLVEEITLQQEMLTEKRYRLVVADVRGVKEL
ncbi:nucleotidyltransferase-like protein [Desmospora activa]|uniref:Nucleotidyltransferase-like protein n=1 Tax=Desmospora activa DSM 45169 TaxID=1121389 RepID=A0A2T4Z3D4_9BACL|nr:nucleotidyltransferase-like protein [Desmospora activa]PTM56404.1 nucleotidyltransferase-like protein [Desmospora activa DSM 45169]